MHRKRFITNSVFLLVTSSIVQVVSLFILPLFIENLGADIYGLFIIAASLTGYLGVLDFGFTAGISRSIGKAYQAEDHEQIKKTVSSGLALLTLIGLTSATLIYFGRFGIIDFLGIKEINRNVAERLLVATAIFSLLEWPMRMPKAVMVATLNIKSSSIISAITNISKALATLFLVLYSEDVVLIMVTGYVFVILECLLNTGYIRKKIKQVRWSFSSFSLSTLKSMSGFSLGIFYTQLLAMLSIQVDQLIIASMIGVGMIPAYVISSRFFAAVSSYTGSLFGALLPTIYSLDNNKERHRLQSVLDDGVRYRALLISPLAYLGIVISPSFISVWMGGEYVKYAIWSQLFMVIHLTSVFGIATNMARGLGHLRSANILLTLRVALNLAVSIALVSSFGIGGPVIGSVLASVILGDVVFFGRFSSMCGLKWKSSWGTGLKILSVNLPCVILLSWLSFSLDISSWFSIFAYSVLSLLIMYATLFVLFVHKKEKQDLYTACEVIGVTRFPLVGWFFENVFKINRNK